MERFVLPVWDRAVSVIRRKSEASSEALEAPSIMRTHLGEEVHEVITMTKALKKLFGGINLTWRLCQENCVSLYNKLHKALHYITAVPGPFPEQPFFDGNDVKR